MKPSYYEELARYEAREADRRMVFTALRSRRVRPARRAIVHNLLWLLGVTR